MKRIDDEVHWLSGLDEAGYGPTLGPLVVGMATLRSASRLRPKDPWRLLAPTVLHRKKKATSGLTVADSKILYSASRGTLEPLELPVLAFVAAERGGSAPRTFRELIEHLTRGRRKTPLAYLDEYPWYQGADLELPVDASALSLRGAERKLLRRLEGAGLTVAELRARPIEVVEFNRKLGDLDSKGEVNGWAMGGLMKWLWSQPERRLMSIATDRLGGRTRYGPFLYPLFDDAKLDIVEQAAEVQRYLVTSRDGLRRLDIDFRKGGEEECFATALASMTAKYVRELHMRLFNQWWRVHAPELRPTAGYPQDARRFLADIEPLRRRIGVPLELLARLR